MIIIKSSKMAKKHIVVIENEKNNNPLKNPEYGFLDDVAQDYFENFYTISDNIKNSFPNNTIPLAINSFLISTDLDAATLLAVIKKNTESYKPYNVVDFQIYITEINDFIYATTKEKELELNYILNK